MIDTGDAKSGNKRKLAFVVNSAAAFVSHRLPIAIAAMEQGYTVQLFTGQAGSTRLDSDALWTLKNVGITHTRVGFRSDGINPLVESWGLLQLTIALWRFKPDAVHCSSPKGIIYGGLAARAVRATALILAISGRGYAFTSADSQRLRRAFAALAYTSMARLVFGHRNMRVIVQNQDDRNDLLTSRFARESQIQLIPGSGVHLAPLIEADIDKKSPMVLLPARMLVDKGVMDFVDAVSQIKDRAPEWTFVLAGAADHANPTSIPEKTIKSWEEKGLVKWLGHVTDMAPLFAQASIVCLPSYREGMPKALLEAAAAGCAVVTTDTIGCREAVLPGESGDLVPVRNSHALAQALLLLINDDARRRRYAVAGRNMAIAKFDVTAVVSTILGIYDEMLQKG